MLKEVRNNLEEARNNLKQATTEKDKKFWKNQMTLCQTNISQLLNALAVPAGNDFVTWALGKYIG